MYKKLLPFLVLLLSISISKAQYNEWTWMKGASTTNGTASYGIKGVESITNNPPALWHACEWTDLNGDFWVYGGFDVIPNPYSSTRHSSLWRYRPSTNMWTWMGGGGAFVSNAFPNYGSKGIASANNWPGSRAYCAATWVDQTGNLWLFGGQAGGIGTTNDLWKYDITTNLWTWVSGTNTLAGFGVDGVYGTKNVPSVNNIPPSRMHTSATWVDDQNNLWLFGGIKVNSDELNDLWKYNIATKEWTWVSGDNAYAQPNVYGTKGIAAITNKPGARRIHCSWKDTSNNLWFFGGFDNAAGNYKNDVWKFDIAANMWTWMSGSTAAGAVGISGAQCVPSTNNIPRSQWGNRARWTDDCGNLWVFSTASSNGNGSSSIFRFSSATNEWTWVSSNTLFSSGVYGTQGVSSSTNIPPSRTGAVGFRIPNKNEFWLFGGDYNAFQGGTFNDLWKYVPDKPTASYTVSVNSGPCPLTVNFTNSSTPGCNEIKSYSWNFKDPSSGSNNISTTANPSHTFNNAGTYTVQLLVINCTGSKDSITKVITVTPCGSPQVEIKGGVLCNGDCMDLTASATGGSPSYTYSWLPNIGTGAGAHSVCPGSTAIYTVTITDANGITATDTALVLVNPPIDLVINTINIGCNNTTGAILTTVTGGTEPYIYLWNNNETSSSINDLTVGDYSLTVTDNEGCSKSISTTITSIGSALTVTITSTSLTCNGGVNGTASSTVIGGVAPYTYNWSTGANLSTANNLSAGTYTLIVTDGNGCTSSQLINITEPLAINITSSNQSDTCSLAMGVASVTAVGGTGVYTYVWSNGKTENEITGLLSGTYTVIVIDTNGCTKTEAVTVGDSNPVSVDAGIFAVIDEGDSTQLTATGTPNNVSYSWIPSASLSDAQINNPFAKPKVTTVYTLIVSDSNGCTAMDTVSVYVNIVCEEEVFLPTSFSPNKDGINDVLYVRSNCIQTMLFMIYNRWGEKIFESTDVTKGWDGTYKGVEMNAGVYAYFIEGNLINKDTFSQQGKIILVR